MILITGQFWGRHDVGQVFLARILRRSQFLVLFTNFHVLFFSRKTEEKEFIMMDIWMGVGWDTTLDSLLVFFSKPKHDLVTSCLRNKVISTFDVRRIRNEAGWGFIKPILKLRFFVSLSFSFFALCFAACDTQKKSLIWRREKNVFRLLWKRKRKGKKNV